MHHRARGPIQMPLARCLHQPISSTTMADFIAGCQCTVLDYTSEYEIMGVELAARSLGWRNPTSPLKSCTCFDLVVRTEPRDGTSMHLACKTPKMDPIIIFAPLIRSEWFRRCRGFPWKVDRLMSIHGEASRRGSFVMT